MSFQGFLDNLFFPMILGFLWLIINLARNGVKKLDILDSSVKLLTQELKLKLDFYHDKIKDHELRLREIEQWPPKKQGVLHG